MSHYDVNSAKYRSKNNSFYSDLARSARSRTNVNMPHLNEFRRTKSSIAHRDLKASIHDKEDSFSAQFQKQILSKKSFLTNPTKPDKLNGGTLVIRRKPEEKLKANDKICMERQNLTSCPVIESEENLRLLNYQYNFISQIQHLDHLKKLILLDLYDNRIERISGLDNLRSLRVLMLGRNRIKQISGLSNLLRLDVLDLHGNSISVVENLSHLTELRVLNVAGNNLKELSNSGLKGLGSLIELNARRNSIETVTDVNRTCCPNLQRVYLSYNQLLKMSDFQCLEELPTLSELSVDNNPVSQHSNFRAAMVTAYPQLDQLDMKNISEDERVKSRQIVNKLESTVKPNSQLSKHLNLNSVSRYFDDGISVNRKHAPNQFQKFHSLKDRRRASTSASNTSNSSSYKPPYAPSNQSLSLGNTNPTNLYHQQQKLAVSSKQNECLSHSLYITDPATITNDFSNPIQKSSNYYEAYQQHTNNNNTREFISIEDSGLITKSKSPHPASILKHSNTLPPSSSSTRPSSASGLSSPTFTTKENHHKSNNHAVSTYIPSSSNSTSSKLTEINISAPIISSECEEIKFSSLEALRKLEDREYWANIVSNNSTSNNNNNNNITASVTTIVFHTIPFCEVEKYLPILKSRFPNFRKIVLSCNQLNSYSQINSLAVLKRLDDLVIESLDNPIVSYLFLRSFIIFRLAHLGIKYFQHTEITPSEFNQSRRCFLSLSTISPHLTNQFHLLGLITDTRRRELLHSTDLTAGLHSTKLGSGLNTVSVDLVGKSGLVSLTHDNILKAANNAGCPLQHTTDDQLKTNERSESCSKYHQASSAIVDSLLANVERQTRLTDSFHSNWVSVMLQMMHKRFEPIKNNKSSFMRRQLSECSNQTQTHPNTRTIK